MKNPFCLDAKVILITGASSGIGRQCAISCSQMGAKIILVARNEERLKETFLQLYGEGHLHFSLDVTLYDQIESVVQEAVEKLGKISGFIHSAGIEMTKPLRMLKPSDYERIFAVNVISGFEIARVISKKKYSDNGASLVFIASIMAELGQPGKISYCASKSALVSGAKAMALELSNRDFRVNSVSPAVVETEMSKTLYNNLSDVEQANINIMHPLGLGSPVDVANACIYLLSDASKWVTGTSLIVDGGYSAK